MKSTRKGVFLCVLLSSTIIQNKKSFLKWYSLVWFLLYIGINNIETENPNV